MQELNSADFSPRYMFSTLHSTATRDFWPIIGSADFAWLACVCVVACTTCDRRRLSRRSPLFKLLPVTTSMVPVIRIWIKMPLIFLICTEITVKKPEMDQVKNDFLLPSHMPNWTSCQSYFLAVILSRHVLKIWQSNGLKKKNKQNCLLCQNLEASEASLWLLRRLAKFWQSAKIWQVFETGGHTYFTLLVDRFIMYTDKIGSGATWA